MRNASLMNLHMNALVYLIEEGETVKVHRVEKLGAQKNYFPNKE